MRKVLRENPEARNGYKIVYDEKEEIFGLGALGTEEDRRPVFIAFTVIFWMHT